MRVKPNETRLLARVRAIRPAADGWGADVDLEVLRNETRGSKEDFLGLEPGTTVAAFTSEPEGLEVGERIHATLALNAGPSGERTLMRTYTPVKS